MVYYPIAELRFDVSARLHSSVLPAAIHLSRCGSGLCSCEQVATTALTVHRTVIHYRNAASLPQGKAWYRTSGNEPKPSPLGKVPRNEADEEVKTLASNLFLSIKQ